MPEYRVRRPLPAPTATQGPLHVTVSPRRRPAPRSPPRMRRERQPTVHVRALAALPNGEGRQLGKHSSSEAGSKRCAGPPWLRPCGCSLRCSQCPTASTGSCSPCRGNADQEKPVAGLSKQMPPHDPNPPAALRQTGRGGLPPANGSPFAWACRMASSTVASSASAAPRPRRPSPGACAVPCRAPQVVDHDVDDGAPSCPLASSFSRRVVPGVTEPTLRTLRAVYGKLMVAAQKRAAEAMAALAR